jgi:hypothetical protein
VSDTALSHIFTDKRQFHYIFIVNLDFITIQLILMKLVFKYSQFIKNYFNISHKTDHQNIARMQLIGFDQRRLSSESEDADECYLVNVVTFFLSKEDFDERYLVNVGSPERIRVRIRASHPLASHKKQFNGAAL